jgi:tRNA 2-thiouridine synthesizing protein B
MLHIVNKSSSDRSTLDGCLRFTADGAGVLLIEDGVYAATRGNIAEVKLRDAMGKGIHVYVLQPDLEARGMQDKVMDGVRTVDYGGFVDLVAEHNNCQSWL